MMKRQSPKTLRSDAKALAASCPAWNARLAARRITAAIDCALAPAGLGIAQLGLLAEIAAAEDDTMAGLARATGLEQSTLSRNLRTLEKEGLVEIAMVESDQRRRAVWLTEAGTRRLEAALPLWRKAQSLLAAQLPGSHAVVLARQSAALAKRRPHAASG